MFFTQNLSSLATQPAQGKGGDGCEDGARRKEIKRALERVTKKKKSLIFHKQTETAARSLRRGCGGDNHTSATGRAGPSLSIDVHMLLLPGNVPDASAAALEHGGKSR